jgi:hypothetical protein
MSTTKTEKENTYPTKGKKSKIKTVARVISPKFLTICAPVGVKAKSKH